MAAKKGRKKGKRSAKRGKAAAGAKRKGGGSKALAARVTRLERWKATAEPRLAKCEGYSLAAVNALRRRSSLKPLHTMHESAAKALPSRAR